MSATLVFPHLKRSSATFPRWNTEKRSLHKLTSFFLLDGSKISFRCFSFLQCLLACTLAPVVQQILQRSFQRDLRLPAGLPQEFGVVAQQYLDIRRPHPAWIRHDVDIDVAEGEQQVQHFANRNAGAGGDVVAFAGIAFFQSKPIGPYNIPHIGKVPLRGQVADMDAERSESLLDLGNLLGEVGCHELLAPARARMIEGAGADHMQIIAFEVLVSQIILCCLAHSIWT